MLANFFDKTKPINSILLAGLFFSFYFTYRFRHTATIFADISTLETIEHLFSNMLFLLLCGMVFAKNGLTNDNLYSSFLMILLYGMFPSTFQVDETLIITFLFLLVYRKISGLKEQGNALSALFDSGFYVGVSFLFFNWSALILLFIYTTLLLSKRITPRTLMAPVIGVLVPVFLFFTYCFVTDTLLNFYHIFNFNYNFDFALYSELHYHIPLLLIAFSTVISVIAVLPKVIGVSNVYRFQYTTVLNMLLIGTAMVCVTSQKQGSELLYVFIPISILIGRFINDISKKIIKELFLYGLTFLSIVLLATG